MAARVGTLKHDRRALGSPSPNDRLTGFLGGCIVHAIEVQPQKNLASPPGLGVQDLDTGSNPREWCIGARPAGTIGKWVSGAGRSVPWAAAWGVFLLGCG